MGVIAQWLNSIMQRQLSRFNSHRGHFFIFIKLTFIYYQQLIDNDFQGFNDIIEHSIIYYRCYITDVQLTSFQGVHNQSYHTKQPKQDQSSTKSKKPMTRFSLSLNTLTDMLLPVLFLALKQCIVHILGNLPEHVIPVLALILNFTQTETEQKNGMFLAFAFFVTYQQISSAVSRTIHAVLLQVFMPNVQMKRYERMTQFMTSGFGIIFAISAVINIVLFVVCNQIVTVVFYDIKYNRADQQFIDGDYSIDSFYSIKYLAIEGIMRPIQSFVVYSSEITHNVGCYAFVVIVRYTATIGMFLIAYFTNVTKSIDYMVLAELSVDICCIMPLISQIQHINNIKIKINTQEGFGMILNNSISQSKHSKKNEEDLVFDMEQIKPMPLPSLNMNRQQGLLGQSTTSIEPSSQLIEDKQIRDSNNKFTNSDSDLLKFAK
ncbi:Hypothetical_protein [Hexamita inflata]|uniref:Hypothetical_protein n=1 Tax=Hexamita inflata TaxID=28002 RepID=A0ABP1HJS5_9EUKA